MPAALISLVSHWRPLLLAAAAAVSFGLGVRWQRGEEAIEKRALAARQVARVAGISQDAERKLARLRERNTQLARRTAHEIAKPEYRCELPDAGRLLYNAAAAGTDPGEPDAAMPGPAAAPPGR